jgi:hypothetical protein
MKSQDLKLNYAVDNKLTGNGDAEIGLDVNSMDSFKPENIAKADTRAFQTPCRAQPSQGPQIEPS